MFAGTGGSGNLSEAIMYGGSTGPWKLRIILEFSTSDIYGNGSRWLVPNVNSDPVVLGQWHRIEIYYKHSTTTTSGDGIVRWWMDGRQQGEYDQVNFVSSGWNMFQFSPTWGGTGDTKTETDHFWFDHVHLSHP